MAFSPFDKRLLAEGLDFFSQPRLASLLELLGETRIERVEVLATMLRNGSPDEFDEAVDLFDRAMARVEREQAREEPRQRRQGASAERREQRRRSS
jgi:hypothetical protein